MKIEIELSDKDLKLLNEMMAIDRKRFSHPAKTIEEYIGIMVTQISENRRKIFLMEELQNLSLDDLRRLKEL